MNFNHYEKESSIQRAIKAICFVIGLPCVLIPFIGTVADICWFVGLFRYWGEWGGFIGLLVIGVFTDSGRRAVAESLNEKGPSHYDTIVMGTMLGVLQYAIIWMCLRTFF